MIKRILSFIISKSQQTRHEYYCTSTTKFLPLIIMGHNDIPQKKKQWNFAYKLSPRHLELEGNEDWVNLWPGPRSYCYNLIPLPIRQGYVKNYKENNFIRPGAYANTELMKIPNFLHLTPVHIERHCAALKRFCTKWPEELNNIATKYYFPLEFIQTDYIHSAANMRDSRSRIVTLKFELKKLQLVGRERFKFLKLIGPKRYNEETDIVTIVGDRCPSHRQNYDYLKYVLTALTNESKKFEKWELENDESDWLEYQWDKSLHRENLKSYCEKIKVDIDSLSKEKVNNIKNSVEALYNSDENEAVWENYKTSILELFQLNKSENTETL